MVKEQSISTDCANPRLIRNNAKLQSFLGTQQKMDKFSWEVLMYPCSPDLRPSDFYMFQSLQNSLGSVRPLTEDYLNYSWHVFWP